MENAAETSEKISVLLRDTLKKSNAGGYVVGISGGVDSALAATLCCRAVGPARVRGIFLPSAVTPARDAADVAELAEFLSMRIETIPIDPVIRQYRTMPGFQDTPYLTGNLMARTRMAILYYTANRESYLVCGTSNRTEYLLGYCTKHGDNAADVQPILHLLKTGIWDLARHLGIPQSIIDRAPTAGLWQGQTDEGELGLTYAEIDTAIMNLDEKGWIAGTEIEEKVVAKRNASGHKQVPAPSLLGK
jgi:NAD+ synthase